MKLIVILISFVFLVGCNGDFHKSNLHSMESGYFTLDGTGWLRSAPESFYTIEAQQGKYSIEFHEVVTHEALAAVYSLSEISYREINPGEANALTGFDYKAAAGKKLYLVRAAFHPSGTGDYEVRKIGDKLLVLYDCLGHSISPERSAIVVALNAKPSDIFIEIQQAE